MGILLVIEIRKTEFFSKWIDSLKDIRLRSRILVRIERLSFGNPGDVKPIGEGVSELRLNYGSGYRIYYKKYGKSIIVLLIGGDKKSQSKDIKTALQLAKYLQELRYKWIL